MTLFLPFESAPVSLEGLLLQLDDDDGSRWYQQECNAAIFRELEAQRSTLIVMATGLGKTFVFTRVAQQWDKGPVLVLAHREELVEQAARALERVVGESVEIEKAGDQASFRSRYVVGSVQSVCQKKRLERMGHDRFSLIITDECFPGDTPIATPGGPRPIRSLRPDDLVLAIDHLTGVVRPSPVVSVSIKQPQSGWLLCYGETHAKSTANHPYFVRGIGYIPASEIRPGDMLCVRSALSEGALAEEDVLARVSLEEVVGDHGAYEPHARQRPNDLEQPHAPRRQPDTDALYAEAYWSQALGPSRQRDWRDSGGSAHRGSAGLAYERHCADRHEARFGIPTALQDRRGQRVTEGSDRGGRAESLCAGAPAPGQEEGGFLTWVRVDRSESLEPSSLGGDGVYNLEIEGCHNYFAHETLVHNCHHATASSYRRIYDWFGPAKHLGVTATPDRGDEKALGAIFDSVAYVFDIEQGIEDGYLVPIRGQHVDVADVSAVKSSKGDLAEGELDEAMLKAVAGVVHETLRLEPDRKGIFFWPGVRSSQLACETFNKLRPSSCIHIDAHTPSDERRQLVADFRRGQYQYLMNVGIATEGFDCPDVNLVGHARPTKSRALFAQMSGRGTRVLPGLVDHIRGKGLGEQRRAAIAGSAKPDLMMLDFVKNAGRHDLVTPEDLLGGSYSEEEVALAKKKRGSGGDVKTELEKARAELQRLADAARQRKVVSTVTHFDPFRSLGLDVSESNRYARFGKPVPDWLKEKLLKKGVPAEEVGRLNAKSAFLLKKEMDRRHSANLCTFKQAQWLERYGVVAKDVSFERATEALNYIFACRKRNDGVEAGKLDNIINRQREAGED